MPSKRKHSDGTYDKYFEVKFRTSDPSPPEMEEFWKSSTKAYPTL